MTKTEQYLIEQAKQHSGRWSIETCHGRGPNGGRRSYGIRERDAMFKLERAGAIRITSRQPWQDYNRGHGMSGNVFSFELVNI